MQYTIECPETKRTLIETINPFCVTKLRCEDCDTTHSYDECRVLSDGVEITTMD